MTSDFVAVLPVALPALAGLAILVVGPQGKGRNPLPPLIALAGLAAAIASLAFLWGEPARDVYGGGARSDDFGLVIALGALLTAVATVLCSVDYLKRHGHNHPEFHTLVLFATSGMVLMGMSGHMLTLLLGLETMSVALYVLCGFFREDSRSIEASIKYFLTGAFATGVLLFGIALIYGGTGSFDLGVIGAAFGGESQSLILLGLGFILAGFAFKIAAVPFHMWLPDVYDGAPTPVTGFMAAGVKIAAFAALIRVFVAMDGGLEAIRGTLFWIALATMTFGNLAALAQQSVKRVLAYSSIAHAGYLLIAVMSLGAARGDAVSAILYYVFAYAAATLGAFGVLSFLETRRGQGVDFDDLRGLRAAQPLCAAALTVFMLSLAGIPGTAGFLGKLQVFGAALAAQTETSNDSFTRIAFLGILNSLIGLYYYLRVPIELYAKSAPAGRSFRFPPRDRALSVVMVGAVFVTVWFGVGPMIEPVLVMMNNAFESLG